MKKRVRLLLLAFGLALCSQAQEPADTAYVEDLDDDVTFTDAQLEDDNDAGQTVADAVNASNDPFASQLGFRFGIMFHQRAYDNMYNQTYVNGLLMNDPEMGRFSYGSNLGGLNDATRSRESVSPYEFNTFGSIDMGGGQNIRMRASDIARGHRLTLNGSTSGMMRARYAYSTGMMNNGWALAGALGYGRSEDGIIAGTFYQSFSYYLAAQKRLRGGHSLSLVTFGAPVERGTSSPTTEEVYWLANSHYYNPNWGYQNGKKRNARVVHTFSPTAILSWDWDIDKNRRLSTAFGFKYSQYAKTYLGRTGDAYDPRPDYYKNLPSSIFQVYDETKNNPTYLAQNPQLLEQWHALYDYWKYSTANRQIDWDRLYFVNRQSEAAGGEALYYQENNHSNQLIFALSPTFTHFINRNHKYAVGVNLNHTTGMHFKTMEDLLGATRFTDVDSYAVNDYGENSQEAQNDLNKPNRQIREGDKFGYNYNILVNFAKIWTNYQYSSRYINLNLGAHIDGTTIERDGKMRNGRAPENSYGKSGMAKFLAAGGNLMLTYTPVPNNTFGLGGFYTSRAPLARNAFVADRIQNNFVDNLRTEKLFGGEAFYLFRSGEFHGKIGGYYTRISDQTEKSMFYNDQEQRFTYLSMTNVEKQHYGIEGAIVWQATQALSFNMLLSINQARYMNNPRAQVNYEGMNGATIREINRWINPVTGADMPLRVIAKDMHVSSTPLTVWSIGTNYNKSGWFFELNLNYYNRNYLGFSQYQRLSNVLNSYTASSVNALGQQVFEVTREEVEQNGAVLFDKNGNILRTYSPHQKKFDSGLMLNASIGRFIRLRHGRTLSINLRLNNLTDNRKVCTYGFEQNRDDFYETGEARGYQFSQNPKISYAYPFNATLNIGLRF